MDVDFTFFLIEDEIGEVHQELASNYRSVILSRAEEAIKNVAAEQVSFTEFFQERKKVESLFRSAVEERWQSPPSLHCTMDQFHLGRIRIPQSVATKQLEARVQNERNDKEEYLQEAQIERERTTVEVNQIDLNTTKALRTAEAEASLGEKKTVLCNNVSWHIIHLKSHHYLSYLIVQTKALAEAQLIKAQAGINGTRMLLDAAGIETQDHKTAFTYIKTLRDRKQLDIDVSYLAEDSVLRTAPV